MFRQGCEGGSREADKFETLCNIRADLSTAPYKTKRKKTGTVSYTRDFDMILLVGLTELKAQIGWIDSATVSSQDILSCSPPPLIFAAHGSRGWRKGSDCRFQSSSFPRLNFHSRSDAVVVYDNPSEEA